MDDRLRSRKFWLAVGSAVGATGLLVVGQIDMPTWQWVMNGTVIGYLVAQGAVDAAGKLK